jgi:fluoroacetyl-CoA thioesterase
LKSTLKVGLTHELHYRVPKSKTVAALYPESPEFQQMPEVFANGFMVGLLEWACIVAINPHLDWPAEQTVGTHVNVSHNAPTPPGMQVTAKVKLVSVQGRKLLFEVEAHDGVDLIAQGSHERFVIQRDRFSLKAQTKLAAGH